MFFASLLRWASISSTGFTRRVYNKNMFNASPHLFAFPCAKHTHRQHIPAMPIQGVRLRCRCRTNHLHIHWGISVESLLFTYLAALINRSIGLVGSTGAPEHRSTGKEIGKCDKHMVRIINVINSVCCQSHGSVDISKFLATVGRVRISMLQFNFMK